MSVAYGPPVPLPAAVEALATERLSAVDAALPGLVTALWITGSAVGDDWWPDRSDVDFVAATARPPGPSDLAALAAVHAVGGLPHFDGIYLPAADLAGPPVAGEAVPHVVDGVWSTGPCGEATPVTWLELRERGVAVRGPAPATLVAAPDEAVLRDWLLGNLRGYWAGEADTVATVLAAAPADQPVGAEPVAWLVLGAARLHATLRTGAILSKTATGRYVAEHFPAYAVLAARCAVWRAGAPEAFDTADGLAAAALVREVVASAG